MSTISTKKSVVNWCAATQREDACQACAHVHRSHTVNITNWYCTLGGYYTSALAVCDALAIRPEGKVPHAG